MSEQLTAEAYQFIVDSLEEVTEDNLDEIKLRMKLLRIMMKNELNAEMLAKKFNIAR